MKLYEKYKTLFEKNNVNTPLRIAHFMAQVEHESGGFRYLTELGGRSYFNKYEGRLDLGNTKPGDGFNYRGRGYIQVTGRANYQQLSKDTGIDFIKNPDLLSQEANAIISALWFWNKRKLNQYADLDDVKTITKKINGGYNGFDERKAFLAKYKKELL